MSDADRATARSLGQDGQRALAARDFRVAEDDFRRADQILHAPTLVLGVARALVGEGRLVEAQETYFRIVHEGAPPGSPEPFLRAIDEARAELKDVEPRIGGLTITVRAADGADIRDASVTLDGVPLTAATIGVRRSIDPGTHVVHVTASGYRPVDLSVAVGPGGAMPAGVVLEREGVAPSAPGAPRLAPVAPTAPAPVRASGSGPGWPVWAAFGVGVVGLGVGGVAGGLALGKHSDLASSCTGGVCGPAQADELSTYHSLATVSTVGFIVGGVGAATGIALWVLQPKASTSARLSVVPVIGLGSLGAVGRF